MAEIGVDWPPGGRALTKEEGEVVFIFLDFWEALRRERRYSEADMVRDGFEIMGFNAWVGPNWFPWGGVTKDWILKQREDGTWDLDRKAVKEDYHTRFNYWDTYSWMLYRNYLDHGSTYSKKAGTILKRQLA